MSLWGGRFAEGPDAALKALNDSLRFDQRLARVDILGSMAYAQAIADAGVISADDAEAIRSGLAALLRDVENDDFPSLASDEDIHTAVERRLTEIVGAVGGKLHTGRSRNDQVATDLRLWTMDALDEIDGLLLGVQRALIGQAEAHVETLMPGYTHLQPAQPITAAHWLMSFFWMVARDRERLQQCRRRTAVSPLGAGALAGNPFPIDRHALAEALGFASVSQNSLDAVSDRDFVAESLFTITLTSVHLSRFAEDLIIYSNPAFGFVSLSDRYSTGSSLMPQKRNADPMELSRAKVGRLIGHMAGLLTTLKGLPSSYNKDLQEDKEALFDAVDTMRQLLPVVAGVIQTLHLNPDRMRAALSDELLATELADYLVRKGIPFRAAHHLVGEVVQFAGQRDLPLSEIPLERLQMLSDAFADDVSAVFDFRLAVERKAVVGGTAPQAVMAQIAAAKALIDR
ncbi:MAG: argininosuccinate lyase [Anaerolineales bacterium]|nr:argininosuccinate lyase [Anaerolineales bacterium]MCB9126483.1 argininosuccinate lyase [Ardenticatenales bacterium]